VLIRFSFRGVLLLGVALGHSLLGAEHASAEAWQDGDESPKSGPPVYQWHPKDGHASDGHGHDERHDRRDYRRDSRYVPPQVSAGWFQRPYPYHLDYYKMRYGGSYAPYFGNLYGTPQVVNYPPYYGPYYGGYEGGYANGYGQPGYGGIPMAYPANPGMMTPGANGHESEAGQTQTDGVPPKSGGEVLPAPGH
jgi:hypothetical protein